MMRRRGNLTPWLVGTLVILVALMAGSARRDNSYSPPRARYFDASPMGGLGLHLLLDKLGYKTVQQTGLLTAIPAEAKVWLLLDPQTDFSEREGHDLVAWVRAGGTLIWAGRPCTAEGMGEDGGERSKGIQFLRRELSMGDYFDRFASMAYGQAYPTLTTLNLQTVTPYRSGVTKAEASGSLVVMNRAYLEIAGSPVGSQIARLREGKGEIFVLPDPMLFTNYALVKSDNAVLASNLIRVRVPSGTVVFDERNHGENGQANFQPGMLYYLWRPPVRWALLQLLLAAVLMGILAARGLGAPVPLPDGGPVTRASQFAAAMGGLFRRANRPAAAAGIIGETFRRRLARRLGMSPADTDAALAQRAHEISGLPVELVDRLLLQSRTPTDNEMEALRDAQAMEQVLRRLGAQ